MGNVLQAAQGQAPATQCTIYAGKFYIENKIYHNINYKTNINLK